jgi:hypothetical protein
LIDRILNIVVLGVAVVLTSRCYATVASRPAYVDGSEVVYEDGGAYEYERYPSYIYEGRTVYLVGDRWYFRQGSAWAYYRHEPVGLAHHRAEYHARLGRSAPPA